MFKKSQIVLCVSTCDRRCKVGKKYEVYEDQLPFAKLVTVLGEGGKPVAMFASRFQAESVDTSFDVSTATDQELADEYRRLFDERKPLRDELVRRGFTMFVQGQQFKAHNYVGKDYEFRKTVQTTVTI